MEEFDAVVEDFRENLHSKTPNFTELYEAMVVQRQRLGVIHEQIFGEVRLDMDGPFPFPGRIQASDS